MFFIVQLKEGKNHISTSAHGNYYTTSSRYSRLFHQSNLTAIRKEKQVCLNSSGVERYIVNTQLQVAVVLSIHAKNHIILGHVLSS